MRDIQVFLGFANFYKYFIQSFSKIAAQFTSMLTISPRLIILQLSIDLSGNNEIDNGKNGGDGTNLSNLFVSKKSTKANYLTSNGNKMDGSNTKKSGKAV